jgi:hypothetical protein
MRLGSRTRSTVLSICVLMAVLCLFLVVDHRLEEKSRTLWFD